VEENKFFFVHEKREKEEEKEKKKNLYDKILCTCKFLVIFFK